MMLTKEEQNSILKARRLPARERRQVSAFIALVEAEKLKGSFPGPFVGENEEEIRPIHSSYGLYAYSVSGDGSLFFYEYGVDYDDLISCSLLDVDLLSKLNYDIDEYIAWIMTARGV